MNILTQPKKADFLIVGCGLAGSVFARLAAESGYSCTVIDKRSHIGGNSYSYTDKESNVEVHQYGPHIFHTSSVEVWNFVNRFARFNSYVNRVKAHAFGRVYSLPINLMTINELFSKTFSPAEAEQFIETLRVPIASPSNFEEQVISSLGIAMYHTFFKHYTRKQWGVNPKEIPGSTARRIPIRFTYDDNYYNDVYQGIPVDGYASMFANMLKHDAIHLELGASFDEHRDSWRRNYKHLVFTGSLDDYFGYTAGFLPYRKVTFREIRGKEIQGTAVINYTDDSVPFTRIHEHKWFTPERTFARSIGFEEYSESTDSRDEPYYPVRNPVSDKIYSQYKAIADQEQDVIFIGRLAEFRYYDMHQVIGSSMARFTQFTRRGVK
jgi:UDP-galactopyranose mutase